MPHPHVITTDRRDKMLAALRGGALYRDAAEAAGIPWSTWTDWSRAVRKGECNHPDVIELVGAARVAYRGTNTGLTATVAKAAAKDWRAAAWLLEHRQGDAAAKSKRRLARLEADLAALALKSRQGGAPTTVVIELPASLARPREG